MGNLCGGDAHDTQLRAYLEALKEKGVTLPDPQAENPLDAEMWKPFTEINITAVGDEAESAHALAQWVARVLHEGGGQPREVPDCGDGVGKAIQSVFGAFGRVRFFEDVDLTLTKQQWDKLTVTSTRQDLTVTIHRRQGEKLGFNHVDCTVVEVQIGSAAMEAGLGPGMTVVGVGGTEVDSDDALHAAIQSAGETIELKVRDREEVRITGVSEDIDDGGALADTLARNKGQLRCIEIAGRAVTTKAEAKEAASQGDAFLVVTAPAVTKPLKPPVLELLSMQAYRSAESARQRVREFCAARDSAKSWAEIDSKWLAHAAEMHVRLRATPPGGADKLPCVAVSVEGDSVTIAWEDESVGQKAVPIADLGAVEYEALQGKKDDTLEGFARNSAALSLSKWMRWSEGRAEEFKQLSVPASAWGGLTIGVRTNRQGKSVVSIVEVDRELVPVASGVMPGMALRNVEGSVIVAVEDAQQAAASAAEAGRPDVRFVAGGSTLQCMLRERAAFDQVSALASTMPLPASPDGSPQRGRSSSP